MSLQVAVGLYVLLCWAVVTVIILRWPYRARDLMRAWLHRPRRRLMKIRVQGILLFEKILFTPAILIMKIRLLLMGYSPKDWKD